MARTFILWLHGLGDSGPANEHIKTVFKSPELSNTRWLFPSAPFYPVSCNNGLVMPSWFDVPELPFRTGSPIDETSVLEVVKNVHAIIDQEIAEGTNPENVFICGLSQGGALTLATVLLYPKTLGGGAVLSGWVPFSSSVISQFPEEAKKTPILWSHGTDDKLVLFEAGQAARLFLEEAGVTCEFKSYLGLGHSMSNKELRYLESWIKLRLKSSSSTCFILTVLKQSSTRGNNRTYMSYTKSRKRMIIAKLIVWFWSWFVWSLLPVFIVAEYMDFLCDCIDLKYVYANIRVMYICNLVT